MKIKILVLSGLALLAAFVLLRPVFVSRDPERDIVYFTASRDNFLNPERGFYVMVPIESVGPALDLRQKGCSLIMMIMDIREFKDGDISQSKLDQLRKAFDNCRANGLKVIFRAAYGFTEDDYYKDPNDINRMLGHIRQLQPVFEENRDALYAVQAGFIGPWGEWHGSNLGDPPGVETRRAILFALLDVVPYPITVHIRRPAFIRDIFKDQPGGNELTEDATYGPSRLARTGWHNDALLSSIDDMKTYVEPGWSRQRELDWSDNHCRYTPFGGETADLTDESKPDNAVYELAKLHASYIHLGYHPEVIKRWMNAEYQGENAFKYIERRLGYRFVLEQAETSKEVVPGGGLHLTLRIKNNGFSAPHLPRPVFLALTDGQRIAFKTALPDADPRRWTPEKGAIVIDCHIRIPDDIPPGNWNLALLLNDPSERLKDDGRYSIRLANSDVEYLPDSGLNIFYRGLRVAEPKR